MTVIYYADVSPLGNAELFDALYSSAPFERRGKIDRLRTDDARRLSLGAWSLLDAALSERGVVSRSIARTEFGKPYLENSPGIRFNLSHSGYIAMCAISDKEIGCDVERIESPRLALAKRFFSVEEREYLEGLPQDERERAFYDIWTLKESFLKATGTGLTVSPSSFSVITNGKVELRQDISPVLWSIRNIDVAQDYSAACCSEAEDNATVVEIDFSKSEIEK